MAQINMAVILVASALPILCYWLYTSSAIHPLIAGAFSSWLYATTSHTYCPPPGPLLPPPKANPNSTGFNVPDTLLMALPWTSDTSFAIKASIGDVTVFEHEYSAPGREVGQSLFETSLRIGSVTKTFTILAVLLSADSIKLSDSITKFIPKLHEHAYKDVTIAALASHTSGLGRYVFVGDLAIIPGFNPAMLGLPGVNTTGKTVSSCDPFPGGRICTRDELIAGLNNPAYYPRSSDSQPLYSNIAYTLLGLALEAVHSKPATHVIHDLIMAPLGLSKTTFSVPTDPSTALLPRSKNDSHWFVPDFGNYNSAGGLWSTPNDQLTFLQSILSHVLLPPAQTRRWLQPRALAPSLHHALGESWEILRPSDLDTKTKRAIDVFTKTGGVVGYAAYVAIVPEYNIALTINAAGGQAQNAVSTLFPRLLVPLVAYADALAVQQARAAYAGVYGARAGSMTLVVDDGPGLAIRDLNLNGVPVLRVLAGMQKIPYEALTARLYPLDADSVDTEREVWRIMIDRRNRERDFAELQCASWNWGDAFRYVMEPLDTVVFTKTEAGVVDVELLGWRVKLERL